MCGLIYFLCNCDIDYSEIKNRGPNFFNILDFRSQFFASSVLHHQSEYLTEQPIKSVNENVLLWNGENYLNQSGNDGYNILLEFEKYNIDNVICNIDGPYAFLFFDKMNSLIKFGRDPLGRRSLLLGLNNGSLQIISSTIVSGCKHVDRWIELPAIGIYTYNYSQISLQRYEIYDKEYCENIIKEVMLESLINVIEENSLITKFCSIVPDLTQLEKKLYKLLCDSVEKRTKHIYPKCKICYNDKNIKICNHSKIAILFSGGVDSAVLAVLIDKYVPIKDSIDLLNVSFETDNTDANSSPDRLSGEICLQELQSINPMRKWNFVKINVNAKELRRERNTHIKRLIQPSESVLDDSIGCAIWFAARGVGLLDELEYTSPARVVFTGIGADELLAGYSRHRNIFSKHGYEGVEKELSMELKRISSRNMGRDDRVLSCHGRESRFPFLDADLVNYLQSVPVELKCDLTQPRGYGEKLLLRRLARDHLGLTQSWCNEKRAIQFGSRIAKIDRMDKGQSADSCKSTFLF